MLVDVDGNSLNIEVRCSDCDAVMQIIDQYDYGSGVTVEVSACEECEDEE